MNFAWQKIGFCFFAALGATLMAASDQGIEAGRVAPGPVKRDQEPDHRITFAATSIPGVFDKHFPGPYNVIFHRTTQKYAGAIEMEMYPIRRAVKMMQNQAVDCLFVANDSQEFHRDLGFPVEELIFSKPFSTNLLRVYSSSNGPVVSHNDDLMSKSIAVSSGTYQGFWFQKSMPKGAQHLEVADLATAFDLLEAGRVHHVISFSLDAEVYMKQNNRTRQFSFDQNYALAKSNEGIVCWRNEKTLAFINIVDTGLTDLRINDQ